MLKFLAIFFFFVSFLAQFAHGQGLFQPGAMSIASEKVSCQKKLLFWKIIDFNNKRITFHYLRHSKTKIIDFPFLLIQIVPTVLPDQPGLDVRLWQPAEQRRQRVQWMAVQKALISSGDQRSHNIQYPVINEFYFLFWIDQRCKKLLRIFEIFFYLCGIFFCKYIWKNFHKQLNDFTPVQKWTRL